MLEPPAASTVDPDAEGGRGKTFSEGAVVVDPEPVVPAPAAPERVSPVPPPAPAPAPAAAPPPVPAPAPRREPPAAPVERPAPAERAAAGPGSLQVVSRPAGAQVVVDGRAVGTTPLLLPTVPSGRHDVRIELPGFRRWATSVEVSAGARTRVAASLEQ